MTEPNFSEPSTELALPVYKVIEKPEHMTENEAMAFQDNDPVAGTEFREMATLFLQMHDLICDFVPCSRGNDPTREALRIIQARSQALVDNTRNFTRPIRTAPLR